MKPEWPRGKGLDVASNSTLDAYVVFRHWVWTKELFYNADAIACLFIRAGKEDAMKEKGDSGSGEEFGNWFRKIAKQTNRELDHNNRTFLETLLCSKFCIKYFLFHSFIGF